MSAKTNMKIAGFLIIIGAVSPWVTMNSSRFASETLSGISVTDGI